MAAADENSNTTTTAEASAKERLSAQSANIDNLSEISRNSRTTFIGILLACAYSYLTVATTKDAALLSNSVASPLPIIQAPVPLVWFYYFAPLLLLLMFLYFHLYLQRFWRCVAVLPPFHSDGRSLDDYVYPWLISSAFLRAEIPQLRNDKARFPLESTISIMLAWWFIPIILGVFWARYLVLHDWWGTLWHIGLVALAGGAAIRFYYSAKLALRAKGTGAAPSAFVRFNRTMAVTASLVIAGVLAFISHGAISGAPVSQCEMEKYPDECTWQYSGLQLLRIFGYAPYLEVADKKISAKPDDWAELLADDQTAQERLKEVAAPSISTRDLRFMNGVGAFLANTDIGGSKPLGDESDWRTLSDADLDAFDMYGAVLRQAVLSGSRLNGAVLDWADLSEAQLQWAELNLTKLEDAVLTDADLSHAKVTKTKFRRATLLGAKLNEISGSDPDFTDAKMYSADLTEADLRDAVFVGADLRQAIMKEAELEKSKFAGAQLDSAEFDGTTLTDSDFEGATMKGAIFSNEADLSNATFRNADLTKAKMNRIFAPDSEFTDTDLTEAELEGADLRGAKFASESTLAYVDFTGADLSGAVIENSVLTGAEFPNAVLQGTKLIHCNLSGALFDTDIKLEQEQFLGSCGDELTRLPENIQLPACAGQTE